MGEFGFSCLRKFFPSRQPLPNHPMATIDEAKALLWQLEGAAPGAAVADMTNWFRSFSVHDGFTPGRRARVLLLIGAAMQLHWKTLAHEYLAPDDVPLEQRPGNAKLLQLMLAASAAESTAFETCFVEGAPDSRWLEENLAVVLVRWIRSLVRGTTLSHMLQQPVPEGVWVKINFAYRRACRSKVEGRAVSAFGEQKRRGSVRQELIRGALIELASPDRLKNREIELIYRIAARFASAVQLVSTPNPDYMYVLNPETDTGPVSLKRIPGQRPGLLYFDMMNCIAQMQPFYESGRGGTATAPDSRFSSEFTVREGNIMLKHALACWGSHPPERKENRIRLTGEAKVAHGLEQTQGLCALYDQRGWSTDNAREVKNDARSEGDTNRLRIEFDDKKVAETITTAKVEREVSARLLDASASGLGLELAPADARWAKVGVLVGIFAGSARDWVVGVIRRVRVTEQALSVGVEILCHRPRVAWLGIAPSERETVWQEAVNQERNFDTHFTRAILLTEPPLEAGITGDMLLPLNCVKPGVGLELPLADKVVRLRVREVHSAPEDYARVRVEWVPSGAPRARTTKSAQKAEAPSHETMQMGNSWPIVFPDSSADTATDIVLPAKAADSADQPVSTAPAIAPAPDKWQLLDPVEPAPTPAVPVSPADEGTPKDTLNWPKLKLD